MIYFTNKNTLEVYGYESIEDAQAFNDEFENLVEMTDELLQEYKEPQAGHRWSLNGWIEDEELMKEHEEHQKSQKVLQMHEALEEIEKIITRLERIKDRTESEQEELDKLIDESISLYREIKALETEK